MKLFYLIKPKSQNEDLIRKEFIFNVILSGLIFLSLIASLFVLVNSIEKGILYKGIPFSMCLVILMFFLFLYYLSRKGHFILSAYLLIGFYFLITTFLVFRWSADLPVGIISYALIIIISGILFNTNVTFISTTLVSIGVILSVYLEKISVLHPDLSWKSEGLFIKDAIFFSVLFWIIALVSWLSNREIDRSLLRARKSEAALKKEKIL